MATNTLATPEQVAQYRAAGFDFVAGVEHPLIHVLTLGFIGDAFEHPHAMILVLSGIRRIID